MLLSPDRSAFSNAAGAAVSIEAVGRDFEGTRALAAIDLEIAPGEIVALLGPSGCGKTTLLRMLAGLLAPSAGRIAIGGRTVADATASTFVPPEKRAVGMVFQDYALWPHMSVARNVAFPLEMRGVSRPDRRMRVADALRLVDLEAYADRSPATLSGGQQQRVALARAIVSRPSLILFDEPLSNLDRALRESLVVEIATLVRSLGLTGVYVTHDHAEAFTIADRVAVMSGGALLQVAPPVDLVAAPASIGVARFLKLGLIAPMSRADGAVRVAGRTADTASHLLPGPDGEGRLFVPRNALCFADADAADLSGVVRFSLFQGDGYVARVELGEEAGVDLPCPRPLAPGQSVGLAVDWSSARWFPDPEHPARLQATQIEGRTT